jgi:hypothetical protein
MMSCSLVMGATISGDPAATGGSSTKVCASAVQMKQTLDF